MKVYRALAVAMVNETNNRLDASRNDERRARGSAVISNETSWRLARIHLGSEGLDVKLVVPYFLVGDGIDYFPRICQYAASHPCSGFTHCLT
jgi:hypothetical protein